MSSSAPRLKPVANSGDAPADEPAPFCYAEAESAGASPLHGGNKEKSVEARVHERETAAFERGRQTAGEQYRAAAEAALAQNHERISTALAEFARERAAYYWRIESEVVELALAIARKVLHRETQLDRSALGGIVRVTLEELNAGTKIDLFVAPAEASDWRLFFAQQADGTAIPEVREDAAMPRGECRIETSLGTTKVGIESLLKEIETGLLDLLAERPEPAAAAARELKPRPKPSPKTGAKPSPKPSV